VFLIVFFAFFYLTFLNSEDVFLYYSKVKPPINAPLPYMLLASFFLGIVLTTVGYIGKSGLKSIINWLVNYKQRYQKKSKDITEDAYALFDSGEFEEAKEKLKQALKLDETNVRAAIKLSDIFISEGNYENAVDTLNNIRRYYINDIVILKKLAEVYRLKGDVNSAIEISKKVLSINHSDKRTTILLRDLYGEAGKWEEAYRLQKDIVKWYSDKEKEKAIELLSALKYKYALQLVDEGKIDKGIRKLYGSIDMNEKFTPAYISLIKLLHQKGETGDALRIAKEGFHNTKNPFILKTFEDAGIEKNTPDLIMQMYSELMEEFSDEKSVRFYYTLFLLRLEMVDEAISLLTNLEPDYYRWKGYRAILGEAYFKRGKFDESAREMERVLFQNGRLYFPFKCNHCGWLDKNWMERCPNCFNWNTFFPLLES